MADITEPFRPKMNQVFKAGTSTGASSGSIFVTTEGTIQVRPSPTLSAYFFLSGMGWPAKQIAS